MAPSAKQLCALFGHLIRRGRELLAGQTRSLVQVWRQEIGKRQQDASDGGDGIRRKQDIATRCDHHGVDDEGMQAVAFDGAGHGFNGRRIAQHAGFHGRDLEIAGNRCDLLGDEVRRHTHYAIDAAGVLRGECRENGGTVDFEGGERLQVSLNAGAAGRVGAGDRECDRRGFCHVSPVAAA